jgi:magnesium transporter
MDDSRSPRTPQHSPMTMALGGSQRISFVAAARTVAAVNMASRLTSAGYVEPLAMSQTQVMFGESAQEPNEEEAAAMWEYTLIHYGTMHPDAAKEVADLFVRGNLPPPSLECKAFLTHDFLIRIGVSAPGHRARVMLAVARLPAPEAHAMIANSDEMKIFSSANGDDSPTASYATDSTIVTMHVKYSADRSLKWMNLVGKDAAFGTAAYASSDYAGALEQLRDWFEYRGSASETASHHGGDLKQNADSFENDAPPLTVTSPSEGTYRVPSGTSYSNSQSHFLRKPADLAMRSLTGSYESPQASVDGAEEMVVKRKVRKDHATEGTDLWEIFKLEAPMPHMLSDPRCEGRAAFVLRVCTLGEEPSDTSLNALTNKWVVIADKNTNMIAMIHRVDSVAVASLRDRGFENMKDTITFKRVLTSIIVAFLMEFEVALDAGNELLDDCETNLLDHTKHTDILEKLFFLVRKASVYQRMIELNQSLVNDVGQHFDLSRNIAFLEPKWGRLRSKAAGLQDRSTNLLGLLLELSGHRTNELMSVLTKYSLVFMPLTFVSTLYGMNFVNMPELDDFWGYPVVMMCMFVVFTIGTYFARKL